MSTFDEFVHVSTGPPPPPRASWPGGSVPGDFFENTKGLRQYTQGFIVDSIRRNHPKHHLTVTGNGLDFAGFGASQDDVKVTPHDRNQAIIERYFMPPFRRFGDDAGGSMVSRVVFGAFDFTFKGTEYLIYIVTGVEAIYQMSYSYVLVPIEDDTEKAKAAAQKKTDLLLAAATTWQRELHNEVLVFDQGWWQKSAELWNNIQKASWEDVILEKEKKETIIDDVIGFFDSQKRYEEFGVPWKRGVIFYGPPGNGKTISTKALMHDVSKRISPKVESLYVKTFSSYQGPEYSIREIFQKAREVAPCLLIFEDIDSLVHPGVRSYFLNEVDGLESNHGILMIGSTNHLERLDPGIAKRPSRFDRKYLFSDPNKAERVQYAEYWRHKLQSNKKIDFPKEMSTRVAEITGGFSFAYMKEAFVAALLVIVAKGDAKKVLARGGGDNLVDNLLWKELKKQVENLRKEMDDGDEGDEGLKVGNLSMADPIPNIFNQGVEWSPWSSGGRNTIGQDIPAAWAEERIHSRNAGPQMPNRQEQQPPLGYRPAPRWP